jgi:predicted Fe-Mo cluster-binding NifX family protein
MNETESMRIIVACENEQGLDSTISQHFGCSPAYAVVEVRDSRIESCETVSNPYVDKHVPRAVPHYMAKLGADAVIAGGIGQGAISHLQTQGIRVATRATGSVRDAIPAFLEGRLSAAAACESPGHRGGCHGHGQGRGHGPGHRQQSESG